MMNKNKSVAILLVILSLGGTLLAGCEEKGAKTPTTPGSPGASAPANNNAEGLKIGTLLSATGDVASIAAPLPEAVKLVVKKANDCGGVNGKPVTVVSEDDQSKPEQGVAGMTKLTEQNKVAGVVGSFASGVSTAAASIAAKNKVMLISPGSTSPVLTEAAKKGQYQGFWSRTAPSDVHQAPALAKLAFDKGFKKVATIAINNDYGVGFEKEFIVAFKKLGGTVTNESKPVRYDPKAASLTSEVAAAFAGKPQAIAAIVYPDETGPIIIKESYSQGLSKGVQLLFPDAGYSTEFPTKVGKGSDGKFILAGAIGTVPGASGTAYKDFAAAWKTTGKPLAPYLAQSWDAGAVMMLAAQAAKANTGEGIMSKIREVSSGNGEKVSDICKALAMVKEGKKINYEGASGNVDIDENGDVIGSYDIWQVQPDGTLKVTGNVAVADPKAAGGSTPAASAVASPKTSVADPKKAGSSTPVKTN
jgi:neutral amino acid transport system substrate-binding protein